MKDPKSPTLIITEQEAARELHKLRHVIDGSDRNAGPAEFDQLPVTPRLQAEGDVGAEMGMPPAAKNGVRLARNALLVSLRVARTTGHEGVHYSRDRNAYTRQRHNTPDYWTYNNMRAAVDTMLAHPDLIRENRARPQNPYAPTFTGKRSVLFAGPAFVDAAVDPCSLKAGEAIQDQRIILRDRRKMALIIPAGPIAEETMRFQALFDNAVGNLQFTFSEPSITWLSSTLAVGTDDSWKVVINTARRDLTRIFTGSMLDGGRFYRCFWLELPKTLRRALLIDGAPTAEHDYAACHLRLAYFAIGERLPVIAAGPDHYTLEGFGPEWRPVIKRAVSILLNARNYVGAVGAIAGVDEMPKWPWEQRVEMAITIVAAIIKRHEVLTPLWHSGCGLGLQYVDSQLTIACATELIGRGIVPLPVHDSMLVRAEHLPDLEEVMERRFEEDGPPLAAERFKSIAKKRARGFRGHDLTLGRTVTSVVAALSRSPGGAAAPAEPAVAMGSEPSSGFALPATIPGPSFGGEPLDLALLRRDPIILDLECIIAHRKWVAGGVVRSALLTSIPLYPSRSTAAHAVRAWIGHVVTETSATFDKARFETEVARFVGRMQRPITAQSIARLCGVTATMAAQLGLTVVVPQRRRQSLSRRAKRMVTTLPRIINIQAAAPWGDPRKRAAWFKRHSDAGDRQVLALEAILSAGNAALISSARASIERAVRERATQTGPVVPEVDRLLARLQFLMLAHDLAAPAAAASPATEISDVECVFDDRRIVVQFKPVSATPEDSRRAGQAMLAALAAITDQPVRILTL